MLNIDDFNIQVELAYWNNKHYKKYEPSIYGNPFFKITPYENHRQKTNNAYQTISLDQIDLLKEPEVVYQSKNNKKTKSLIDKYVDGAKDRFSIKSACIIRDAVKVTGTKSGIPPINFAFFYDDEQKPKTGGTGHTMEICEINKVPYFTQKDWEKWF